MGRLLLLESEADAEADDAEADSYEEDSSSSTVAQASWESKAPKVSLGESLREGLAGLAVLVVLSFTFPFPPGTAEDRPDLGPGLGSGARLRALGVDSVFSLIFTIGFAIGIFLDVNSDSDSDSNSEEEAEALGVAMVRSLNFCPGTSGGPETSIAGVGAGPEESESESESGAPEARTPPPGLALSLPLSEPVEPVEPVR